jgi:hypothetical protein
VRRRQAATPSGASGAGKQVGSVCEFERFGNSVIVVQKKSVMPPLRGVAVLASHCNSIKTNFTRRLSITAATIAWLELVAE